MAKAEEKRKRDRERQKKFRESLTPEQLKKLYAKNSARRSAKRAARAIAQGRIPGKCGPRALSPEEKKLANSAKQKRWRKKNLKVVRAKDASRHREIRATEDGLRKSHATSRKYREKNKEKVATSCRLWREKNLEKDIKRKRNYYENHKEEHFAWNRTRRAKIRSVGGKHTAADIAELLKKQKGKCAWCLLALGDGKYHVDHYVPLALGGSNDKSNLRILHPRCNLMKNKKHPADFAKQNGLLCW